MSDFVVEPDLITTGVSVTVVDVSISVASAMSNPSKYYVELDDQPVLKPRSVMS